MLHAAWEAVCFVFGDNCVIPQGHAPTCQYYKLALENRERKLKGLPTRYYSCEPFADLYNCCTPQIVKMWLHRIVSIYIYMDYSFIVLHTWQKWSTVWCAVLWNCNLDSPCHLYTSSFYQRRGKFSDIGIDIHQPADHVEAAIKRELQQP